MCVCAVCDIVRPPARSYAHQLDERALWVFMRVSPGHSLLWCPCGWSCLTVCVGVCARVHLCVPAQTPLEYMLALPQAGPANGNGSKQTQRRNHLSWKVHWIRVAIKELIFGSPLLPLNNRGLYSWRRQTCVETIKLKIKLEV